MKGICGVFSLDFLEPGILPGRLIKVAMYTDITIHVSLPSFLKILLTIPG
jgi:hypothetical protein